jgi:hypothetical protein
MSVLAPAAPTAKDVVVALAGAAAAVAGLVLVFMGMVVTSIQGFPGDTPATVMSAYRRSLGATLITFFLSLAGLCVDVSWLAASGGGALYDAALVLFGAAVVGICFAAGFLAWTLRS